MTVRRVLSAGLLTVLAAASVSACGAPSTEQPSKQEAVPAVNTPAVAGTSDSTASITITDPWVKTTRKGMSAAFGTLVNNTDTDVTVVSGSSPLSPKIELHEVADSGGKMVMQSKEGGFVIPARGTHLLQPGGDHIMLMGVTQEVKPGAQIPFTLTLNDGETLTFTAVGKDFAGGKEDYQPGVHLGKKHG
ncbi:copper chaperone PCu(A)C [Streptosporangium sp. NPDC087985]|uniref:copper chaperone PCu(A)C n=1 Tax=Streptosporangium sp. NPDC087985 TaxID=3366196 RepID=UPI00382A7C67